MLVADDFKNYFRGGDQSRGQQYFREARVTITHSTKRLARSTVRGNRVYHVELEFVADEMFGTCTCPRFLDGEQCKHIWATLLQLEHDGGGAFKKNTTKAPKWEKDLTELERKLPDGQYHDNLWFDASQPTQHWYVIDLSEHVKADSLSVDIYQNTTKKDGSWGKAKHRNLDSPDELGVTDPHERQILLTLNHLQQRNGFYYSDYAPTRGSIPSEHYDLLLPLISQTGRFVWTLNSGRVLQNPTPIRWDGETLWQLHCTVVQNKSTLYQVNSDLRSEQVTVPIDDVVFALNDGLVLFKDRLCRLDPGQATWINWLRERGDDFTIPASQIDDFCKRLVSMGAVPNLVVDKCPTLDVEPHGKLTVGRHPWQANYLVAEIDLVYGRESVSLDSAQNLIWNTEKSALIRRNQKAEMALIDQLKAFPFQRPRHEYEFEENNAQLRLHKKWLSSAVQHFVHMGWEVVAEGRKLRRATAFDIRVTTNTDWFDLSANIEFGETTVSLPTLIAALRKNNNFVVLNDGSQGILPEEWLADYQRLVEFGQVEGDEIRFPKAQTMLLDAMLAERENVTLDRDFSELSQRLREFDGIKSGKESKSFQGTLRDYQRDGLGWFQFLRDFHFGGCLADDMGLGKTVQVLALLEARRKRRLTKDEERRPSLVVVPKSLVFNWMDEAARFTPNLRIENYTGLQRAEVWEKLKHCDLALTTYGTLRRDIAKLKDIRFDYAVLDESQAIKNSTAQVTKASRLIQSDHRLAMTGTPIENHLGELWSLFEFLNPGMLGRQRALKKITSDDSAETVELLRRALQPFILRRTKEQVLSELPPKTEQTLQCEMTEKQQALYNELRDYYRLQLTQKVKEVGVKRSKIHVLEALLRLRQAACDPRLLDVSVDQGAKLDLLEIELEKVLEEGHKALVFSQFTSLLALVRESFDKKGWTYEYLDGRTRNRAEHVKRFQGSPECQIFLISLKAGGHGLNLTAADYVFILDPWWNPAVEAQAVDRSHRIGQTRPVFAYRLICRDTVEEKIVQLQQSKRELADGIIAANESLISELSENDLEFLFE